MSETSTKSSRQTSKASPESTFALELEDGTTRSSLPDSPTTSRSGHALRRASPFPKPERVAEQQTLGIFGPKSCGASQSAALSRSLVSRLVRDLDVNGSIEYLLIWKQWDLPSGRSLFQLRASPRPIFVTVYGLEVAGYPTVDTHSGGRTAHGCELRGGTLYRPSGQKAQLNLEHVARLVGFPTIVAADGKSSRDSFKRGNLTLNGAAKLVGYPTLRASDGNRSTRTLEGALKEAERKSGNNDLGTTCHLVGYATPTAMDGRRGVNPPRDHDTGHPLSQQIGMMLAGWATIIGRDHKDGTNPGEDVPVNSVLGRQVHLAGWGTVVAKDDGKSPEAHLAMKERMGGGRKAITSLQVQAKTLSSEPPGSDSPSSPAETVKPAGSLNPSFGRWLQGYPVEWDVSADTVMQSSRR